MEFENIYVMYCTNLATQHSEISFCLCSPLWVPVMHIAFWFKPYSIIKVFSFSTIFLEKISGSEQILF